MTLHPLLLAVGLALGAVLAACAPSTPGTSSGTGGAGGTAVGSGEGGGGPAGGGAGGGSAAGTTGGGPGGRGGTSAGGGAGTTGTGGAADRSAGCGMAATQQLASFVRATVDVAGTSREYFVYLPQGYDSQRAYPVVFLWHGAGGTGTRNNVPIQSSSGQNAILVGGTALVNTAENRTQWQFNSGANSPDVAFFDAMVAEISARYCIDRGRLFSSGFSSGGWFTNLLGCVRGNVIRAQGVVAGGLPGQTSNCPGAVAAWFLHDTADMENLISGNERARARILGTNGCGTTTAPDEPTPCVRYQGCRDGLPVVWCATTGAGHSVQSSISGPGMWRFFSSL